MARSSGPPLPRGAKRALHFGDPLLVPLVERPLLDPLGTHESGLRQDLQMLAGGRLANAQLRGDEHAADAVAHEVAVDLRRGGGARRAGPPAELGAAVGGPR